MWTRERILRQSVGPAGAALMWLGSVFVLLAALWNAGSLAFEAPASPLAAAALVCRAASLATLVLAAYVDSVRHLLPDPLLLLAAAPALMASALDSTTALALASCAITFAVARWIASLTSLGHGDAKLLAVIALLLGDPLTILAAITLGTCAAGANAIALFLGSIATLTTQLAFGPWLVAGCASVWTLSTMPPSL